jgi:uncharacterized membrane protein
MVNFIAAFVLAVFATSIIRGKTAFRGTHSSRAKIDVTLLSILTLLFWMGLSNTKQRENFGTPLQQTPTAPLNNPVPLPVIDPNFGFRVCNQSSEFATIAVMAKQSPESSQMVIEGWWHEPPGRCGLVGRFPKGDFYALATNPNSAWEGADIQLCVTEGKFRRVNSEGYSCRSDERLFGFQHFYVSNSQDEIQWNLTEQ